MRRICDLCPAVRAERCGSHPASLTLPLPASSAAPANQPLMAVHIRPLLMLAQAAPHGSLCRSRKKRQWHHLSLSPSPGMRSPPPTPADPYPKPMQRRALAPSPHLLSSPHSTLDSYPLLLFPPTLCSPFPSARLCPSHCPLDLNLPTPFSFLPSGPHPHHVRAQEACPHGFPVLPGV